MRVLRLLITFCVIAIIGCGDDDGSIDAGPAASGGTGGTAMDGGATGAAQVDTVAWASEWITAYDREIAATCPCLI